MVQSNQFKMKSIITVFLIFFISLSFSKAKEPPTRITEILNSGDGKSAKTAFVVYSIDEEYQLLEHLKLNPKIQMLAIIDGEYFDIILVGETPIYFKLVSKTKNQST